MDVILPGTTFIDDERVVGARVRPIDGHDELFIEEQADGLAGGGVAALLLERCVTALRVGGAFREAAPHLDAITVGDREGLLLRLAEISFGRQINLVATCSAPDCGEPMDLDLTVDALCVEPIDDAAPIHEVAGGDGAPIRIRLPTAGDLSAVGGLARDDPSAAATALARRCLVQPASVGPLDHEVIAAIEDLVARLDPQAEIELTIVCPSCGETVTTGFDAGQHLVAELALRRADLDVSLHLLAFHYHWSESQILDLPISRRRRYTDLLADVLGEAG